MVKVEMTRAEWDIAVIVLRDRYNSIADSIADQIEMQVYEQEY